MADLDTDELLDFRNVWIRDLYDASGGTLIAHSEFNRTRQQNFFTDEQINAINASVENDWEEELDAIWQEKFDERSVNGDDDATCTSKADVQELEARYRIIRVRCREQMMEDPGFQQSLMTIAGVDALPSTFKAWAERSAADLTWVRSRSGIYNRIELERG